MFVEMYIFKFFVGEFSEGFQLKELTTVAVNSCCRSYYGKRSPCCLFDHFSPSFKDMVYASLILTTQNVY